MPLPLTDADLAAASQDQSGLPVDLPPRRIYINTADMQQPQPDAVNDPYVPPTPASITGKLLGLNGQERYQLWPERLIRDALSAPHDVMNSPTPVTSQDLIKPAMDVSALAGTGGLAGAGEEAGAAALGSSPFLRPALKYEGKIYKAPVGGQHMDAIPEDLRAEFTKQAMNGDDISNFDFGFMNHKGQFLSRENALKYAIDQGLLSPHDARFGALTSTLIADSSKEASALDAAKNWNVKGYENQNWYHGTTHDFDKFDLNKGNIENHLGQYPHFTNSPKDASANYAGHGPDLTGRIERRAEEIMNNEETEVPPSWNTKEYKDVYEKAKAQAAKEIAGPHEGAVIPAKLNMKNPADITPDGKTWIDFNPKLDKNGEWVKDHPNMSKLLNSLKKQGEEYGFDGQKAFDQVAENANLYEGDIKASELNKALRSSEELMYAEHPEDGKMIGSHVAANVFKDLGFDGIVMDAKSAFPNMKNIDEGTLHAVPLKKNTVQSKLTGKTLFADSSKEGAAIGALEKSKSPFYSALEKNVADVSQNKMTGNQWLGTLSNKPGVKPEELDWTGLQNFLKEKGNSPVTKAEVQSFVNDNKVNVREKVNADKVNLDPTVKYLHESMGPATKHLQTSQDIADARRFNSAFRETTKGMSDEDVLAAARKSEQYEGMGDTKYHSYQLPGGNNYRETLLTLPPTKNTLNQFKVINEHGHVDSTWTDRAKADAWAAKNNYTVREDKPITLDGGYKSSHWDEPNVLAHIRTNERDVGGVPSHHIEEIQSDWHQQGKKVGYKNPELEKQAEDKLNKAGYPISGEDARSAYQDGILTKEEADALGNKSYIPNAPFKKSWPELAMKRAIRQAVEEGKSRVSWTPGEAQAARYDLSKRLDGLKAVRSPDGKGYTIEGTLKGKSETTRLGDNIPEDKLADTVGKEMAQKIKKDIDAAQNNRWGVKNKVSGNWSQRFSSKQEAEDYQKTLPESIRAKTDVLEMAPKYAAEYKGLDLKVGGEGMKGFYDEMLPKMVERIGKKYGVKVHIGNGKVGRTLEDELKNRGLSQKSFNELPLSQRNKILEKVDAQKPVHYFDIPEKMKQDVLTKGFSLFSNPLPIPTQREK